MAFADLTLYITVGVLMAAIILLLVSISVICLPGLIRLFPNPAERNHNMKKRLLGFTAIVATAVVALAVVLEPSRTLAYPPAVGILGQSRNCVVCHANNGPWKDDKTLIIDILDKTTGKSLKQKDGTFLVAAKRWEAKTVVTVIGTATGANAAYRNAWLYIDPERINDTSSLNKFAPGWSVNLPMSCRVVGDSSEAYPNAAITTLPMTIRPGDDARDGEIELQVMLTKGESVKGKPREGMVGNYFERKVRLKVE
jgi:hypothetical protein